MDKSEVSASALLTVAITLLTLGVDFMKGSQYVEGSVCVVCGVGLIFATIVLIEKGVISRLSRKLSPKKQRG